MSEKKKKILELAGQEPKLTRAAIARQVGCSTPYVTNCLGAERKYTKKRPDMCPGCEDATCKSSGCISA